MIDDDAWIKTTFIPTVQKRGAAIIEARGQSSAASAANAAINHVQTWHSGTADGDWVSMGIPSTGAYGSPEGVIFSYPVTVKNGEYGIVEGLDLSYFDKEMIKKTGDELLEERRRRGDAGPVAELSCGQMDGKERKTSGASNAAARSFYSFPAACQSSAKR